MSFVCVCVCVLAIRLEQLTMPCACPCLCATQTGFWKYVAKVVGSRTAQECCQMHMQTIAQHTRESKRSVMLLACLLALCRCEVPACLSAIAAHGTLTPTGWGFTLFVFVSMCVRVCARVRARVLWEHAAKQSQAKQRRQSATAIQAMRRRGRTSPLFRPAPAR